MWSHHPAGLPVNVTEMTYVAGETLVKDRTDPNGRKTHYEYDALGNETGRIYMGVDDHPVPNRTEGYAIKTVAFDACSREIESKFFDAYKHPVRSKKGYAVIRKTYDENNNVKEEA